MELEGVRGIAVIAVVLSHFVYLTIVATMLVLVVLLSRRLTAWLSRPKISALGKYTFSLYLVHLLVLYTVACSLFLVLHESLGYNKTVFVVMLLSIPVLWATTKLFERYIDAPSIRLAKWVGAVYRGEQAFDMKGRVAHAKDKVRPWAEKYVGLSGRPELNREAD